MRLHPLFLASVAWTAVWAIGCGPAAKKERTVADPGDLDGDYEEVVTDQKPDEVKSSAQSFNLCSSVRQGDLRVVEIMFDTVDPFEDWGQWFEVQSARSDCELNLKGLKIETSRDGAILGSMTIDTDFKVPPGKRFVVAATTNKQKNHNLPGAVIGFEKADILSDHGATITLSAGPNAVETLRYPDMDVSAFKRSFAFPAECAVEKNQDWRSWVLSRTSWPDGEDMNGSPNEENTADTYQSAVDTLSCKK